MQTVLGDVRHGDILQKARSVDSQEAEVYKRERQFHMRRVRLQHHEEGSVRHASGEESRDLVEKTVDEEIVSVHSLRLHLQI